MRLLALATCTVLCACAPARQEEARAPEPVAVPEVHTPREGPTRDGQRDLDLFVSFFTGNFDPKPGEVPVRLRVAPFWKGSPVRWLYLEWSPMAGGAPTRQRVVRVAEDGVERMTATLHRLPDASRYAGEWARPAPFASLAPASLAQIPGCRLTVTRMMIAHFTMVTDGNRCVGDMRGAPYMRYEFSLSSSELALLEQPRDAAGQVPPRSRLEPFQFGRMSQEPK